MTGEIPAGIPPAEVETARDTLAGAVAASEGLPEDVASGLLEVSREAFSLGLQVSALASAVLAAATAVLAAIVLRDVRVGSATERPDDLERTALRLSPPRSTDEARRHRHVPVWSSTPTRIS